MMNTSQKFEAQPLSVPTLDEIAKLYLQAQSQNDTVLLKTAELAVQRLAAAEAAAAEAATLVAFGGRVKR